MESTTTDNVSIESSWGYIADDVMDDRDRRTAVVDQRRIFMVAQMKKRGLEPVGEVVVTRLDDKAAEAPPGCSGYRFEIRHLVAPEPAIVGVATAQQFFTSDGVDYVSEGSSEPRVARPGERYARAADAVHARRKPYGRQYGTRR
jgi:hypothetical protein